MPNPEKAPTPPRRKKHVLTKAQWDKIEQQARRSEREPDELQQSLLPETTDA